MSSKADRGEARTPRTKRKQPNDIYGGNILDKKSNPIATLYITVVSLLTSASICISVGTAMYVNSKADDISEQVAAISEEEKSRGENYEKQLEELSERIREIDISIEEDINPIVGDTVKLEYAEAAMAEVEEELIAPLSKERLPDGDTNTYRCMDYRTITNHRSVQWALQEECFTDPETGIRYLLVDGHKYFCSAMGSAYGQTIGDAFHLTLQNGYEFDVIYGEFKNALSENPDPYFFGHPDVNYDGEVCTSLIEFIYDKDVAPLSVIMAGTMSKLEQFGGLYGDGGNIVSIKYLGKVW